MGRPPMPEIEVFRTNVLTRRTAAVLLRHLRGHFLAYRLGFDLSDHDRVLRVESPAPPLEAAAVAALLHARGFVCEPLPD